MWHIIARESDTLSLGKARHPRLGGRHIPFLTIKKNFTPINITPLSAFIHCINRNESSKN
ncbi:hypothetical protein [Bergeyella cardium]|uniref:Uncharacterized protein n=1 Tax=Bergeyella cardium TaxID=1585976 RepID=A0A6P1QXE1_9FLAO|nr:hypothetical protein [Bergeyella cardium]QHN65673.1 hypothetical protein DBX24_07150 [Bergeyella cardium]WHE33261.1 hypothetical protein P8603_07195 [Bergeyella cardium]WHF59910.1 hypothetical protein O0R51_07190 [Bergeyella cardium]